MQTQAAAGNGAFSYGELRWPEPADGAEGAERATPARSASRADALEQAARDAYLTLFEALAEAGTPHPLRLWNYLPRINACDGGIALEIRRSELRVEIEAYAFVAGSLR
jgi:hypothetical protein